jgi:hypothetical protein
MRKGAVLAGLALLAALLTLPALANDSTVELATSGLIFVHNDNVEMRAEDLFISAKVVQVRCGIRQSAGGLACNSSELRQFMMYPRGGYADRLATLVEGRARDRGNIPACSEAFAVSCDRCRHAFDDVVRSDADPL